MKVVEKRCVEALAGTPAGRQEATIFPEFASAAVDLEVWTVRLLHQISEKGVKV